MDTVHECDRQTDRITMTKTAQRIASRGKSDSLSNKKLRTISLVRGGVNRCINAVVPTRRPRIIPLAIVYGENVPH